MDKDMEFSSAQEVELVNRFKNKDYNQFVMFIINEVLSKKTFSNQRIIATFIISASKTVEKKSKSISIEKEIIDLAKDLYSVLIGLPNNQPDDLDISDF